MKCKRQPVFLQGKPTKIENLWEVHLSQKLWNAVVAASKVRKISYSAVTRYCVFRLAEKEGLRMTGRLKDICEGQRRALTVEKCRHRHLVCLYGQDVRLLRLAALQLDISVSALIRLALALFLPLLAMEKHSRRYVSDQTLFDRGIKRWLCIQQTGLNLSGLPALRQHSFSMFLPWQWWS